MRSFGKELILDLNDCNPATFTREHIEQFFIDLCEKIDMERCDLHWWDFRDDPPHVYEMAPDHLKGTSAIQFIMTSNITIHTLDVLGNVFLNIFSCKDFDPEVVRQFSMERFGGLIVNNAGKGIFLDRGVQVEIIKQRGYRFLWIDGLLWMWDIPVERAIQKRIAGEAFGDVLAVGYGLGMVQEYLLQNNAVTSVTTVEIRPAVIDVCREEYGEIFGEIITADFYKYLPHVRFDCIVGDICEEVDSNELSEYVKFKEKATTLLKPDGQILQWGKEFFESLLEKGQ